MSSRNQKLVPEAKEALNKFKMEAANEVGVQLKNGYNGDLTSKQTGSIGGQIWVNIRANPIGSRLIIFPYSSSCFLTILMYYLQSLPRLQKNSRCENCFASCGQFIYPHIHPRRW